METEYSETVVGKAVAYMKEILRLPSDRNRMTVRMTPQEGGPDSDDAFANEYTFKTVAEVYVEKARRELGC